MSDEEFDQYEREAWEQWEEETFATIWSASVVLPILGADAKT